MSAFEKAIEAVLSYREPMNRCASAPVKRWAGGEKRDDGAWTLPYPEYHAVVEGFFAALGEFLLLWVPTSSDYLETSR